MLKCDEYKDIQNKFGFLSNLLDPRKDGICRAATKLMEAYVNDFEDCFPSEMIQFSDLYKTVSGQEQKKTTEHKHGDRNAFATEWKYVQPKLLKR